MTCCPLLRLCCLPERDSSFWIMGGERARQIKSHALSRVPIMYLFCACNECRLRGEH